MKPARIIIRAARLDVNTLIVALVALGVLTAGVVSAVQPSLISAAARRDALVAARMERQAQRNAEAAVVRLAFNVSLAIAAPVAVAAVTVAGAVSVTAWARNAWATPPLLKRGAHLFPGHVVDTQTGRVTAIDRPQPADLVQAQALATITEAGALARREWWQLAGAAVQFVAVARQYRDALPVEVLDALPMGVTDER